MSRSAYRFHDFIGQRAVVDLLRRQLAGAQARAGPFPTTLLSGPSGCGKSALARSLAREYGTAVVDAMGYDNRELLAAKLGRLNACDFLLVDECHRLGPLEQELLCEAIDTGSIPPPAAGARRADPGERTRLPDWCLLLATDQPGRLFDSVLKRVVLEAPLELYPVDEVKEIVEHMAAEGPDRILLSAQAARLIAEVAGGLPRRARQYLQNLRLFHRDAEARQLTVEQVREYLEAAGVDELGLGRRQNRYLQALAGMRVGSLESLALRLGCDASYAKRQVEPMLVRLGFVEITPAGRRLTAAGRAHLDRPTAVGAPGKEEDRA
jgi:Holliday junction DNA helicase RuvB